MKTPSSRRLQRALQRTTLGLLVAFAACDSAPDEGDPDATAPDTGAGDVLVPPDDAGELPDAADSSPGPGDTAPDGLPDPADVPDSTDDDTAEPGPDTPEDIPRDGDGEEDGDEGDVHDLPDATPDVDEPDIDEPLPATCGDRFPLALPPASARTSTCGGEGQTPCVRGTPESYENGAPGGGRCDRGLRVDGDRCVNDTRHAPTIRHYRTSWEAWAVAFQRDQLGLDEPLNHTTLIGTNNAYNVQRDGYVNASQWWSLSDQLDAGVRSLNLDVTYGDGRLQLCGADGASTVCLPTERGLTRALEEIRQWLTANPSEILVLRFDDEHLAWPDGLYGFADLPTPDHALDALLGLYFGDLLLPSDELEADRPWPTRRALLERGIRVIALRTAGPKPATPALALQQSERFGFGKPCFPASTAGSLAIPDLPDEGQPAAHWVYLGESEDRRASAITGGVLQEDMLHPLDEARIRWQTLCAPSLIELDMAFASEHTFPAWCLAAPGSCPDPDLRLSVTVWSFAPGDRGHDGPARFRSDGRWSSMPDGAAACACARTEDPLTADDWALTDVVESHGACAAACEALPTSDGLAWRFSAPVRAPQNAALAARFRAFGATDAVHIAVRRLDDGTWSVRGAEPGCTEPPTQRFACASNDDCYTNRPLDITSDACCEGQCTARLPDYLGIPFCPHECKVSASAPPGTCGSSCYEYYACGADGQSACTIDKCFPSCTDGLAETAGLCRSGTCYERFGCGGDGQDACPLWECFPSCDDGLREFAGQCTSGTCYERHGCGGDGQPACNVTQCLPSCDEGLHEYALSGTCTSDTCYGFTGCGGDDQRACNVWECFPSCADGLTEYAGRCAPTCFDRWDCGGEGQPACTVSQCFPSCRPGLTEYGGVCTARTCHEHFNCGGNGQRACTIGECLPSCRGSLREFAGQCAETCYDRWNCGGQGQSPCTIDRCFPSCRSGLGEYGGMCHASCHQRYGCGGEGQRPCLIVECLPSCLPGLREDFIQNRCVR